MKRIVSIEAYIGKLKERLKAKDDFKDFKYYRSAKGDEYAVLSDIIGNILILDITGYSEDRILHCVAKVLNGETPVNAVLDRTERLKVARLF